MMQHRKKTAKTFFSTDAKLNQENLCFLLHFAHYYPVFLHRLHKQDKDLQASVMTTRPSLVR